MKSTIAPVIGRRHKPVFSTEALLHTKYVTKRRKTGFEIELRTLGEKRWLAVIIELE
jgi:hypothetical protein